MKTKFINILIFFVLVYAASANCSTLDLVVASVDGSPITLKDISDRLTPKRNITLSEASSDIEFRSKLDEVILEELIIKESTKRGISASKSEINRYLENIAERNGMTKNDFITALNSRGMTLKGYKSQIKTEILKTRLVNVISRDGTGVTEKEVKEFLESNEKSSGNERMIELSEILIKFGDGIRSEADASNLLQDAISQIKNDGNFSEIALKLSEGPTASDGGSLGKISESDLDPSIYDLISGLDTGSVSEPLQGPDNIRVFMIKQRFDRRKKDASLSKQARLLLENQKLQKKLESFFTVELYKLHFVDKKI